MAMLAEKKRREKWCLNPRGKAWSDDKTKFGQRLLEKMGWSDGQGLGANNQGLTEIVKVKKKDDSKGFGFKENGEEWLKTTSEFNELLDQLGSGLDDGGKKMDITYSLEDRSKKSRARVHYHKFTRGKDLSRYSEKDLASIVGPEVMKSQSIDGTDVNLASNQLNKGSSAEYFTRKKKFKELNQSSECKNYDEGTCHGNEVEQTSLNNKKCKKSKRSKEHDDQFFKLNEDKDISPKKKKKRKIAKEDEDCEIQMKEIGVSGENGKISKKIKRKFEDESTLDKEKSENAVEVALKVIDICKENISKEKMTKIKGKNISTIEQLDEDKKSLLIEKSNNEVEELTENDGGIANEIDFKKKKKKIKYENTSTTKQLDEVKSTFLREQSKNGVEESIENVDKENISKKKKKKVVDENTSNIKQLDEVEELIENDGIGDENISKKKKTKLKDKNTSTTEQPDEDKNILLREKCNNEVKESTENCCISDNENISKKKKKKIKDKYTSSKDQFNEDCIPLLTEISKNEMEESTENSGGIINNEKISKKNKKKVKDKNTSSIEETNENNRTLPIEEIKNEIEVSVENCIFTENTSKTKKKKISDKNTTIEQPNKDKITLHTEKIEMEIEESIGNIIIGGKETIFKKQKKKLQDKISLVTEQPDEENSSILVSKSKKTNKKVKNKYSFNDLPEKPSTPVVQSEEHDLSPSKSDKKLRKERMLEGGINELLVETLEEQTLEARKLKKKLKKESKLAEKVNNESHFDETTLENEQANSSKEPKGFLEVLGRRTRLKKINIPYNPAKHVKYDTQEFMSLSMEDPKNQPNASPQSNTIQTKLGFEGSTNSNAQLTKISGDPTEEDCNIPKNVISHEFKLLRNKLKQLGLTAPEVRVIQRDSATLSQATLRKKILNKSKLLKTILPPDDLAEIEASVKKYARELQPKIDMINTLLDMEKNTTLLMQALTKQKPSSDLSRDLKTHSKEKTRQLKNLDPDKVELLKNISNHLQLILDKKEVKSAGGTTATSNASKELVHSQSSGKVDSIHQEGKKPRCLKDEEESASKDNVPQEGSTPYKDSLQAKIEGRLQVLIGQMQMLVEANTPSTTKSIPCLQSRGRASTQGSFRGGRRQITNTFVGRSHVNERSGSDTQSLISPVFTPNRVPHAQNQNVNAYGEDQHHSNYPGSVFQPFHQQRGRGRMCFGRGRQSFRGSIPFGGWGVLQSYEVGFNRERGQRGSAMNGHFRGRGFFVNESFEGGRGAFRERGRDGVIVRGRISQNNYDAKQYAEKCKELQKVPELAFNGVDLKVISGYAAKNVEINNFPGTSQTTSSQSVKKSSESSEATVEKKKS